jgi:hypothetical protein
MYHLFLLSEIQHFAHRLYIWDSYDYQNKQFISLSFRYKGYICIRCIDIKLKQSRYTPRRRLGERRCSSCSFWTSALDGGEWSASSPGRALPPEEGPPVPIVQEVRWAPEPVWTQRLEEKFFAFARD